MAKFIPNKVSPTQYTDGSIRLDGSILDGLKVLAWKPPHGKRLVWMDEMGRLCKSRVEGFILAGVDEIAARSHATARRAALTNSPDITSALRAWPDVVMPGAVWLGVQRRHNILSDDEDVGLPEWAWGHEIVEVEEPIGCFAALGYCLPDEIARFEVAKEYYCELLVEE